MDQININMYQTPSKKYPNFWLLLSLGLAILLAAFVFIIKPLYFKSTETTHTSQPVVKTEVKDSDPASIISTFPEGLFTEKNVEILNSYTATSENGKVQNSLTYVSSKNLNDNEKFFMDYFKNNNWGVESINFLSSQFVGNYIKILNDNSITQINISINYSNNLDKYIVEVTSIFSKQK